VGVTDHFMIIKDGRVSLQGFLVFIYNDSLSTLYNGTSVLSGAAPSLWAGQFLNAQARSSN
jgi:hypothetical protein